MKKPAAVLLYTLPVVLMIALIPFVQNDYLLAVVYLVFIVGLLLFRSERNDVLAFGVGFVAITISEYFFVSTGVETFVRHTLFGIMPFWLPFLWGYAFITVKRSLRILDR